MPPVMGSPLNNQNGVPMSPGFTNPPPAASPLSSGFITNGMNPRVQNRAFGTNLPPGMSNFPLNNLPPGLVTNRPGEVPPGPVPPGSVPP
jgi:hypothetical protein